MLAVFLATLGLVTRALGAAPDSLQGPPVPAPRGYVNDVAQVMSETTRAKLEAFLDQLEKKTGVQFAVLTMSSTAPVTPTEYKTRVFETWGIGKRGKDEGLLMLVALAEREVRFETGYGLEGTLPDVIQFRIVQDVMAPLLRAGDVDGAIVAGVLENARRIAAEKGVTLEWDGRELRYARGSSGLPPGAWLAIIVAIVVLAMLNAHAQRRGRRRRGRLGPRNDDWGGGFWGGGFGGGGFGGGGFGGGGFGGGGFGGGGGSFGGFGGGTSGGGGGGGKW